MRNRTKCKKAHPTGTSQRCAKLRHRGITKICVFDAHTIFNFFTNKVCGNLQPQEEDFEPYESRVTRSLLTNFNDCILKKRSTMKLGNEWKQKPVPKYEEYYSRQEVARANRVECD